MPTRWTIFGIIVFWLGTMGYVGYRDVWPYWMATRPPSILIDLSDEATQAVPARWTVYRGTERIGSLTTTMRYDATDNTYQFRSKYTELQFDDKIFRCSIPELEIVAKVSRTGELRGQTMAGKMHGQLLLGPVVLVEAKATASVTGTVINGQLVGRCNLQSDIGNIDQPLDPVPVPAGQVLNPLLPVSRLRGIQPGQRWTIHEVNPLADAMIALGKGILKEKAGNAIATFATQSTERSTYLAEVQDPTETLPRKSGAPVECWVIAYRSDKDKSTAKTWVAVASGQVLRQEATSNGERLRLEREDQ